MICLCVEASHRKGMGHLFRALNLAGALHREGIALCFVINDDPQARALVGAHGLPVETVPLREEGEEWEPGIVRRKGVRVWVDDRLETSARHAAAVKAAQIPLVTFDDRGEGAGEADLHVAALPAVYRGGELRGKRVLTGIEYLVLNPEIARYRRHRRKNGKLLVTLGGSDTHGATVTVARILAGAGRRATIVVGPAFRHRRELEEVLGDGSVVRDTVPSLIEALAEHDVAITGGGITPFEANALGVPCLVVANEPHEVENAQYLAALGSSVYAGRHNALERDLFQRELDVAAMSRAGLAGIPLDGAERIAREIKELWARQR